MNSEMCWVGVRTQTNSLEIYTAELDPTASVEEMRTYLKDNLPNAGTILFTLPLVARHSTPTPTPPPFDFPLVA